MVPAVLARSVSVAKRRIGTIARSCAPVHLDLMDGRLVPTRSFGPASLKTLKVPRNTTAHLMVKHPDAWICACRKIGIRRFVLHVESDVSAAFIKRTATQNRVVLAMNPGTPFTRVRPLLPYFEGIHVMTVRPGSQGMPFLSSQLRVIRALRKKHPRLWIAVDGGLNERTIPRVRDAGANEFVIGSALKHAKDFSRTLRALTRLARGW